MDRKVISVICDWFYDTENGEQYVRWEVGKNGVNEIKYHRPMGDGDRHYCDVYMEDGRVVREFNISTIEFEREKNT